MSDENSPFWAAPPYILLSDVLQLDKIEPWNVDVGKLVAGFLREMRREGDIDFRVSGNALYSASVIFMKKTRDLVLLGLLPPEDEEDEEELEIPLIRPPFRVTNQRVTLQELLVAMDRVLSRGVRQRPIPSKRRQKTKADQVSFRMEIARANVEESIGQVYEDLSKIMDVDEVLRFVDVLVNNTRTEVVRIFFALLHLFARSYIDIWMDDEDEIWVRLLSPPPEEELEEEIQSQVEQ